MWNRYSAATLIAIEERLLLNQVGYRALPASHGVVILTSETIDKLSNLEGSHTVGPLSLKEHIIKVNITELGEQNMIQLPKRPTYIESGL